MKKKIRTIICFTILLSAMLLTSTRVHAKSSVIYKLDKGTLTISGKGKMPKSMTFKNNKKIKKVVIKKGITSISDKAFYQCKNLKNVSIASSVKTIGNWAFYNTKVQTLKLPKSLKTIGTRAFMKTKIKSVKIPDSVTKIGEYAFHKCTKLSKVTLGKKVKEINQAAFAQTVIKKITIPMSVKKIGDAAFISECLESVTIPGNFQEIGTIKNILKSKKVIFSTPLNIKNIQFLYTDNFQISNNDPNFVSINGFIYTKDRKTLVRIPAGVSNVKVEEGCTTIALSALEYNEEYNGKLWLNDRKVINELYIPKTVTKIDDTSYITYNVSRDPLLFKASVVINRITIERNNLAETELLKLTNKITYSGK